MQMILADEDRLRLVASSKASVLECSLLGSLKDFLPFSDGGRVIMLGPLLSLTEQHHAAEAAGHLARLMTLDAVWTSYLQEHEQVSGSEMPVLRQLTDSMDELLGEIEVHAQRLREIVTQQPNVVEEIHGRLVGGDGLNDAQKRRWQALADKNGGIVAFATEALDTIVRETPRERDTIRNKMKILEGGGHVPGDLSYECGVAVGMAIGFGIAGAWPGAFAMAAVAGAACA
jgi:hypothetical protein